MRHARLQLVVLGQRRLEALVVGIEALVGHHRDQLGVAGLIARHALLQLGQARAFVFQLAVDRVSGLGLGAFLLAGLGRRALRGRAGACPALAPLVHGNARARSLTRRGARGAITRATRSIHVHACPLAAVFTISRRIKVQTRVATREPTVGLLRRHRRVARDVGAPGFVEEVVVIALIVGQHAVFDVEHAVGDTTDQVLVVTDQDNRTLEAFQRLLQHVHARYVQVVRRLVQTQKRRGLHEHLGQRKARLLAAGKHRDLLVHVLAVEEKRAQQALDLGARPARSRGVQLGKHGLFQVELFELVLGEIAHVHVGAVHQPPARGLLHAGHHLQQRGFARAVGSHKRDLLAAPDVQIQPVVDRLVAVGLHHALQVHDALASALGLGEGEVDGLALVGDDDALDALELLHPILNLFGLGRLVAELLDEGLHVGDFLVLSLLHGDELRATLGPLAQESVVVAGEDVELAVGDVGHVVDDGVHESAIVADHEHGAAVALEKVLQPAHTLQVEVVGRLVEQQQVRLAQQQLGQRDAHLPAARELVGGARHVRLVKAQAEKHAVRLAFDVVAVAGFKARAQGTILVKQRGRRGLVGTFQGSFQLGQALAHVRDVGHRGHDLFKHAAPVHLDGLLLQVSRLDVFRKGDKAGIRRVQTCDDIHHGRLARAVWPHERIAVAILDAQRGLGEKGARAVGFRDFIDVQYHAHHGTRGAFCPCTPRLIVTDSAKRA